MQQTSPEKPIKNAPDRDISELFKREKDYFRSRKYQEAIQCLDAILKIDHDNVPAWHYLGNCYDKQTDFTTALKCYDKALAAEPDSEARKDIFQSKGIVLSKLNRDEEAIELFDEIIRLDPEYKRAFFSKGISAKKLHYYGEALHAFDRFIKLDNEYSSAYIEKGNVLINLHRYIDSIVSFKQALEIFPGDNKALNRLGVSFSRLGLDNEAIDCFDSALQIKEDDIDALNSKGVSLIKLGREHEAIQCFNRAIILEPTETRKRTSALNGKGRALHKLQKIDTALDNYNLAIKLDPEDWRGHYNKGLALVDIKNFDDALNSFETASDLDPQNTEILSQIGYTLTNLNRHDDAERYFNSALAIDESCSSALAGKGFVEARKGILLEELANRKKLLKGISDAVEETQKNLSELSRSIESDLRNVSQLFYIQFSIGVFLLGLAIAIPLFTGLENIVVGVLSALGGTTLVVTSITIAPNKIQKNRIDYSQWMIAYFNWINTHYRVSTLLLEQSQRSGALEDTHNPRDSIVDWKAMENIYTYLNQISLDTIHQMELFCEFPLNEKNNDIYLEMLKYTKFQKSELTNITNEEKASDNTPK